MSGCGVTMSSARRPPQTGSPDIGSSGPKVGFGSKVNGSPEPDSTAIRSVLSTGVPAPGECEVDQQHQGRGTRPASVDDLGPRQPGDFVGVVAGRRDRAGRRADPRRIALWLDVDGSTFSSASS